MSWRLSIFRVPKQVIYDQDRVFISEENLGDVVLNEGFRSYCESLPFDPVFCHAYLAIGSSFLQDFRKEPSQIKLLDSAIFYNRQLLVLSQSQSKRIVNPINIAAAALNMANIYWEFFPKQYKNSAERYINLALVIARKTKHEEVIANCYSILSEYAIAERRLCTIAQIGS